MITVSIKLILILIVFLILILIVVNLLNWLTRLIYRLDEGGLLFVIIIVWLFLIIIIWLFLITLAIIAISS